MVLYMCMKNHLIFPLLFSCSLASETTLLTSIMLEVKLDEANTPSVLLHQHKSSAQVAVNAW